MSKQDNFYNILKAASIKADEKLAENLDMEISICDIEFSDEHTNTMNKIFRSRKRKFKTPLLIAAILIIISSMAVTTNAVRRKTYSETIILNTNEDALIEYSNNLNYDVVLSVSNNGNTLKRVEIPANTKKLVTFTPSIIAENEQEYEVNVYCNSNKLNGELNISKQIQPPVENNDLPYEETGSEPTPEDIDEETAINMSIDYLNKFGIRGGNLKREDFCIFFDSFLLRDPDQVRIRTSYWEIWLQYGSERDENSGNIYKFILNSKTGELIRYDAYSKYKKITNMTQEEYKSYELKADEYIKSIVSEYKLSQQYLDWNCIVVCTEYETDKGTYTVELTYPNKELVGFIYNDYVVD